jgi:lysozyme
MKFFKNNREIPLLVWALGCSLLVSCTWNSEVEFASKSLLDTAVDVVPVKTTQNVVSPALFKGNAETYYGIDISHYQGDILAKLNNAGNVRFVICKATQGQYYVDPDFHTNWREAKENQLIRGSYHFYDCSVDPEVQATHFFNTVEKIEPTDIPPVLDIEAGSMVSSVSGTQMVNDIKIFLKRVEALFGRKPILYTNYAFAQEYFKDSALSEYPLWLAEYTSAKEPNIPDLWKDKGYFIWQKSASYHEESTEVDFDEYKGTLAGIVQ